MKIVITSDQHWHMFKEFDRLTEEGKSYRLSLYEKSHCFVREYMQENGIIHWIDAGDLFHSRESVSIPVLDSLGKQLSWTKSIGIKMTFLKGNHDMSNKKGDITSLNILSEYGDVISKRCNIMLSPDNKRVHIHFIPWDENINFVETVNAVKTDIVISHRMLEGAKVGDIILHGESLKGLDESKFDNIFLGHVHEHQKMGNKIWYIGSLIANNFNDNDQEKGFIIYDFDTKTFERVLNPYSPRYRILKAETIEEVKQCKELIEAEDKELPVFYDLRVELNKDQDISQLENIQMQNVRINVSKKDENEERLKDANLLTPQVLLEKYKEMNDLDGNVYDIGKKILEGCLL